MVDVPAPTIVTVEPLIVATDVLLLVYVIAPELLDVGAVIVKSASPKFLVMALKVPKVGAIADTVLETVATFTVVAPVLVKAILPE